MIADLSIVFNRLIMKSNINALEEEAGAIQKYKADLEGVLNTLKGGGWKADAANTFYQNMEQEVLPAIDRLQKALVAGAAATREITKTLDDAEDEACTCMPNFS